MNPPIHIIQGDCLDQLRTLDSESVHCCVTSPPYWGLRDYGVAGQLGLERTPEEYVAKMVEGFREVRRVLREDGTLWLNLGDSYARSGGWASNDGLDGCKRGESGRAKTNCNNGNGQKCLPGLKQKDLVGIPWMVAFALRTDGWYLRQEITWCKKSAMPESVTDRPSTATEKIFLFSKSQDYYYDHLAVRNPYSEATLPQIGQDYGGNGQKDYFDAGAQNPSDTKRRIIASLEKNSGSNLRNYWILGPEPCAEAHFATYPTEIPRRAILLGTSDKGCCPKCGAPWERVVERIDQGYDGSKYGERAIAATGGARSGGTAKSTLGSSNGKLVGKSETLGWQPGCDCGHGTIQPCTVLDPFGGSGTTGQVALELGRKAILIELNPKYIELIKQRTNVTPGLQLA